MTRGEKTWDYCVWWCKERIHAENQTTLQKYLINIFVMKDCVKCMLGYVVFVVANSLKSTTTNLRHGGFNHLF